MRWSAKLAAIAAAALFAAPSAATLQQAPAVQGHTTYANMDGMDPCVAGIAGIVRLRVMWFGGQVLFERAAQEGQAWVYAVQSGAPDPRDEALVPTGQVYRFTDPNLVDWEVVEYNYTAPEAQTHGGVDPGPGVPPAWVNTTTPSASSNASAWHAWVVRTGPTSEDFASSGRPYNFVTLVDTCRFKGQGGSVAHTSDGAGAWESSQANDTTWDQHLEDDPDHAHGTFDVDLYVGQAPRLAVLGEQNLGVPS